MSVAVLLLFVTSLVVCVACGTSVLYALAFGFVLFSAYALAKGNTLRQVAGMWWQGIRTIGNILMIFVLVGSLTALWRACGTVGGIIVWTLPLIQSSMVLIAVFLLNSLMSALFGTSFGTVATMGVICMALCTTLGINPAYAGGAILSGIYFGDRCSPLSSSAALVCTLTHTNIFDNIRLMVRTAFVPFIAACAVYLILGIATAPQVDALVSGQQATAISSITSVFESVYTLNWLVIIPAVVVLALALFKLNVKLIMGLSILAAAVLCVALQGMSVPELFSAMLFGYSCPNEQAAAMLNGGGICSMFEVSVIIVISSAYAGIFQATGLLKGLEEAVTKLSAHTSVFAGVFATAVTTVVVSCNQTLSTILTHQICHKIEPSEKSMMIDLEDSVIVIAALIPWSIAASVPIATIAAPTTAILFAVYLWFLPLWRLAAKRPVGA